LLAGFEYLAEDSVFITPASLEALAVPNFLHLRLDCARSIRDALRDSLRDAVRIRRRSGERKYAVDLRCAGFPVAPRPLSLAALVFLSKRSARGQPLLQELDHAQAMARARRLQPYAAGRSEWHEFVRRAERLPAFELSRGPTPASGVAVLGDLLDARQSATWGARAEIRVAGALS
jgi:hypothetical protein